jgi:steroid delta-isomerase-like uncharacterized protein
MPEQNLTGVARQMIEAFNAGDYAKCRNCLTADASYDECGTQRKFEGPDAVVKSWEQWRRAMPDAAGTITNQVTFGNTVVQEITWKGTHTGALELPNGTYPASNKPQVTRAIQVLVFAGDRIKECRHYFDSMSLLMQLGIMPQQAGRVGR